MDTTTVAAWFGIFGPFILRSDRGVFYFYFFGGKRQFLELKPLISSFYNLEMNNERKSYDGVLSSHAMLRF
jgi:hypothetical protein